MTVINVPQGENHPTKVGIWVPVGAEYLPELFPGVNNRKDNPVTNFPKLIEEAQLTAQQAKYIRGTLEMYKAMNRNNEVFANYDKDAHQLRTFLYNGEEYLLLSHLPDTNRFFVVNLRTGQTDTFGKEILRLNAELTGDRFWRGRASLPRPEDARADSAYRVSTGSGTGIGVKTLGNDWVVVLDADEGLASCENNEVEIISSIVN